MTDVVLVCGRFGPHPEEVEHAVRMARDRRARVRIVVAAGGWRPETTAYLHGAPVVDAELEVRRCCCDAARDVPGDVPVTVQADPRGYRGARRAWAADTAVELLVPRRRRRPRVDLSSAPRPSLSR